MTTVHLVDGTFELFRCFHGAPRAQDADGREVGAARALAWTLVKLLRTDGVEAVVVTFDAMSRPRRADGSANALLRSQGSLAVEVSRALGLPTWTAARGQADDLMASAAAAWRDRARIVLCTADKDLHQCVRGDQVVVLDRIRDRMTDQDEVRRRYGLGPEQLPDLVALIGDPSDGLPGVPGWGPKSGATVIAAHGRLDD
ncbi:MAG: flap endonuclease, partial [Myxococcales bacterium]|nr:flap endonuclease [Myxococcales bacterium]